MKEMQIQYQEMRNDHRAGPRSELGGLFFDEVKIREDLVYDPSSGKLVGFVDQDAESDGESEHQLEDVLATNVTQFYSKSLFTSFSFLRAYFLTSSVKFVRINDMFWTGVHALHEHGFDVLLACRDGASYNRSFFAMNLVDNSWKCSNDWTTEPIFVISDPSHLKKKLRNQLFNSRQEDRTPA